jgi:hypothetical protein
MRLIKEIIVRSYSYIGDVIYYQSFKIATTVINITVSNISENKSIYKLYDEGQAQSNDVTYINGNRKYRILYFCLL